MSKYIDAEKLLDEFNALVKIANNELNNLSNQTELDFKAKHYEWRRWATILSERGIYAYKVEQAMEDGIEIVRCKDCVNCRYNYADQGICDLWGEDGNDVFEDGFCNYGEKRAEPDKGWEEWEKRKKEIREFFAKEKDERGKVETIQCKDCIYAEERGDKTHCLKYKVRRPKDWYCKRGEKK